MKLTQWIFFENPGEKDKLKVIMETTEESSLPLRIMKEFNVDIYTATQVIKIYNNNIRK